MTYKEGASALSKDGLIESILGNLLSWVFSGELVDGSRNVATQRCEYPAVSLNQGPVALTLNGFSESFVSRRGLNVLGKAITKETIADPGEIRTYAEAADFAPQDEGKLLCDVCLDLEAYEKSTHWSVFEGCIMVLVFISASSYQ